MNPSALPSIAPAQKLTEEAILGYAMPVFTV